MSHPHKLANDGQAFFNAQTAIITASLVGVIILFSVLGWNSFQSEYKSSNLSGGGAIDTNHISKTYALSNSRLETVLSEDDLKEINNLKQKLSSTTNSQKKKIIALKIANAFLKLNAYTEAPTFLLEAASYAKTEIEKEKLLLKAANTYHDIKNLNAASEVYSQVLEMNEKNTDARVDFALCLIETGKMMAGVDEMKKAVAMSPNHQKANINLGILYAQVNKMKKAKTYWKKAAQINSKNEVGKLALKFLQQK